VTPIIKIFFLKDVLDGGVVNGEFFEMGSQIGKLVVNYKMWRVIRGFAEKKMGAIG
jgi:hypothetical protein